MYYILFYKTVENYTEKRLPFRQEHLDLVKSSKEKGELILAGALSNPADGAVLVFKGDSASAAENFALSNPYVKNGLITEWYVREWIVVTENL